jgi:hypothetical protein
MARYQDDFIVVLDVTRVLSLDEMVALGQAVTATTATTATQELLPEAVGA